MVVRRRRAGLQVTAVLLVVVLLLVGALVFLLARSLNRISETTQAYQSAAFAITDFATVQRELLRLSVQMERIATAEGIEVEGSLAALQQQTGILQRAWEISTIGRSSPGDDGGEDFARLSSAMEQMFTYVQQASEAEITADGLTLDIARVFLDDIELQVKREFDRREIIYLDSFSTAVQVRGEAEARTLVALFTAIIASVLLAAVAGRAAQRNLRIVRREKDHVEQRYRHVVEQVREGILQIAADGTLQLVNPGWTVITGLDEAASIGRRLDDLLSPHDLRAASLLRVGSSREGQVVDTTDADDIVLSSSDDGRLSGRGLVRLPGNEPGWGELTLVERPDGGWVATLMDVTERMHAREELRRQATRDPLTGLANRAALTTQVRRALAMAARRDTLVGLIFIDLDRFKVINDSLGHDAGDRLLRELGLRLRTTLRGGDVAARLGGDEFVILSEGLPPDHLDAIEELRALAERVAAVIAEPVALGEREVSVSASLGIALATETTSPHSLLADGDTAMYRAKELGKSRIEVFDDVLRARMKNRLEIENALHRAVTQDELRVHLQGIHDVSDGALIGFEALIRWQHPTRGLIGPTEFLGVAEDTGAIVDVGRWVLERACAIAAAFTGEIAGAGISVNVSAAQLVRGDLHAAVVDVLERTGLEPSRLTLEITESVYLEADARVTAQLRAIHDLQVRLAMDDFGTGYSSLSSLRALPIDVVKLDRSFVSGLGSSGGDHEIVASVIGLGRSLHLSTVAEGVETEQQLRILRELGCSAAQGYLWGRPAPASDILSPRRAIPAG